VVALHFERGPGVQIAHKLLVEHAARHVLDLAALSAYKVVVVGIDEAAKHVAVPPTLTDLGVYPLEQAQFHQQVQRAKDGGAPYVGGGPGYDSTRKYGESAHPGRL